MKQETIYGIRPVVEALESGRRRVFEVIDAVGNESIATVLLDSENGCGCAAGGGSTGLTTLVVGLGLLLVLRRRRR